MADARIRCPLARWLMLILACGFALLAVDIRSEHVEVVRNTKLAWTPIIYSLVMAAACLTGFVVWNGITRGTLRGLFLLGILVAGLGFYLHNQGHLPEVFTSSVHAWTDPEMVRSFAPPQLAPLAFAGLGLMGTIATFKRFN